MAWTGLLSAGFRTYWTAKVVVNGAASSLCLIPGGVSQDQCVPILFSISFSELDEEIESPLANSQPAPSWAGELICWGGRKALQRDLDRSYILHVF